MPLHIIKRVSELVPEAGALVKRASLEHNLPTNSRDETLLSALELEYMIKVAHSHVDLDDAERVCRAVDLYGIGDEVRDKTIGMVKAASDLANNDIKQDVGQAIDFISNQLVAMDPNLEKIAEASESLWDEYSDYIEDDQVKIYAGAGTLVKEAAVMALKHRATRTGNEDFEKVANIIDSTNVDNLSVEDNRAILSAVRDLEKTAHYTESNPYIDMFMCKSADLKINVGKSVNATDLVKIAQHVGDVLGKDIGNLLSDAHSNKAAIEALPLGEKQVIAGLV